MYRWVAKLLALFGTFILPFLCTVLPYKVSDWISRKGETGKSILSYLMCFGGGIFFGTYLLHMAPEVRKILELSLLIPYHIDYPIPELFVGLGFFIVLFAEKVVLRWNKRRLQRKRRNRPCMMEEKDEAVALNRSKCHRPPEMEMCRECVVGEPCSGDDDVKLVPRKSSVHGVVNHVPAAAGDQGIVKLRHSVIDIEDIQFSVHGCAVQSCPLTGTGECCSDPPTAKLNCTEKEKQIIITMKVEKNEKEKDKHDRLSVAASSEHEMNEAGHQHGHHFATRSIILILALSLHRIFEGMSIGLQTSVHNVASLFVAVMCHETVIGFSLGLQFVKSAFPLKRLMVTSLVCSAIMPVGVAIGTIMTETSHEATSIDIANGLLQAVAMGTFIYVTFFEILQEEVDPDDTSLGKIIAIACGFTMMALLDLIPEETTNPLLAVTPVTALLTTESTVMITSIFNSTY